METQFNVNVKVDIAIDNGTQQFVKDIVKAVTNRTNKPTTTVEIPQPTPAVNDRKPKSIVTERNKEEDKVNEAKYNSISSLFSGIMEKAEQISSTAGECYHNMITTALSRYKAKNIEGLVPSDYESFYKDLEEIAADLDKLVKEEEEKKTLEYTPEDVVKMVKSLQAKAKKMGEDRVDNLKASIKEELTKLGVKKVPELSDEQRHPFMQAMYALDVQLDKMLEVEVPQETEKEASQAEEELTLEKMKELFQSVMNTHRDELKEELTRLGAKNLPALPKEKYPEMKEFILKLQ